MNRKWADLADRLGTSAEDALAPNIPRIAGADAPTHLRHGDGRADDGIGQLCGSGPAAEVTRLGSSAECGMLGG
jgi:hypothetical protein